MGGRALPMPTRRLTTREFDNVQAALLEQLRFHGVHCSPIAYYHDKEDHGDIDIVCSGNFDLIELSKKLSPVCHGDHSNGPDCQTLSIGINYLDYLTEGTATGITTVQVDLIKIPEETHTTACNYFAWNDLGGMQGRIAQALGIKYGFQGLVLDIPKLRGKQRVVLTTDTKTIFEYLGYDFERWQQGFKTREDIFSYIMSSKYAHPKLFGLETLTAENRSRNRDRKMYMALLEWMETYVPVNPLLPKPLFEQVVEKVDKDFPNAGVKGIVAQVKLYDEQTKLLSVRSGGARILELMPMIDKRQIGKVLEALENEFQSYDEFRSWALVTDQSILDKRILDTITKLGIK